MKILFKGPGPNSGMVFSGPLGSEYTMELSIDRSIGVHTSQNSDLAGLIVNGFWVKNFRPIICFSFWSGRQEHHQRAVPSQPPRPVGHRHLHRQLHALKVNLLLRPFCRLRLLRPSW